MRTLRFILDNLDLFARIIKVIRICRIQLKCETETAEEVMKEIEKWQVEKSRITPVCKQILFFTKREE